MQCVLKIIYFLSFFAWCKGAKGTFDALEQGTPACGLQPTTGPWPICNRAAEMAGWHASACTAWLTRGVGRRARVRLQPTRCSLQLGERGTGQWGGGVRAAQRVELSVRACARQPVACLSRAAHAQGPNAQVAQFHSAPNQAAKSQRLRTTAIDNLCVSLA